MYAKNNIYVTFSLLLPVEFQSMNAIEKKKTNKNRVLLIFLGTSDSNKG
jgi:hypothetical protein